jgi:hypothetical protein
MREWTVHCLVLLLGFYRLFLLRFTGSLDGYRLGGNVTWNWSDIGDALRRTKSKR